MQSMVWFRNDSRFCFLQFVIHWFIVDCRRQQHLIERQLEFVIYLPNVLITPTSRTSGKVDNREIYCFWFLWQRLITLYQAGAHATTRCDVVRPNEWVGRVSRFIVRLNQYHALATEQQLTDANKMCWRRSRQFRLKAVKTRVDILSSSVIEL